MLLNFNRKFFVFFLNFGFLFLKLLYFSINFSLKLPVCLKNKKLAVVFVKLKNVDLRLFSGPYGAKFFYSYCQLILNFLVGDIWILKKINLCLKQTRVIKILQKQLPLSNFWLNIRPNQFEWMILMNFILRTINTYQGLSKIAATTCQTS